MTDGIFGSTGIQEGRFIRPNFRGGRGGPIDRRRAYPRSISPKYGTFRAQAAFTLPYQRL